MEQETFHFDPRTGALTPLRSKEYAHDYRYFPEPDLVPLAPTEEMLSAARKSLPELPEARRERYLDELDLTQKHADQLAFDPDLGAYFEAATARRLPRPTRARSRTGWSASSPLACARWGTGTGPADSKVTPQALGALADLAAAKQVSSTAARQVLAKLIAEGGEPGEIVEAEGLGQMEDSGELEAIVAAAIEAEPEAAEKVRDGEIEGRRPLVGYVMKETKGRADGGEVTRLDPLDSWAS